jgi:hypothetical protein
MTRCSAVFLVAVAAMLLALGSGCGSSGSSNNMSAAQAQAVSQQISQAVVLGMDSAFGLTPPPRAGARPSLSTVARSLHPDNLPGCTTTSAGTTCNLAVNVSEPCPGGGTISVAGTLDGTIGNSGNGSLTSNIIITPTQCSVSNLVINGNPDVLIDSQLNFNSVGPEFPLTLSETGGISYGPHPSGNCQLKVTYTINSVSSCTVSGTVCGQSVGGNC